MKKISFCIKNIFFVFLFLFFFLCFIFFVLFYLFSLFCYSNNYTNKSFEFMFSKCQVKGHWGVIESKVVFHAVHVRPVGAAIAIGLWLCPNGVCELVVENL